MAKQAGEDDDDVFAAHDALRDQYTAHLATIRGSLTTIAGIGVMVQERPAAATAPLDEGALYDWGKEGLKPEHVRAQLMCPVAIAAFKEIEALPFFGRREALAALLMHRNKLVDPPGRYCLYCALDRVERNEGVPPPLNDEEYRKGLAVFGIKLPVSL